jgi:hypothetical protein
VADELVDRIVAQVLAALRQQGAAAPAPRADAGAASSTPAGDAGASSAGILAAARQATGKTASPPEPLRVFLTADAVQRRLTTDGGDGTLELEHNEFLTPAASDVVDERRLTLRRRLRALATPSANGQAAQPSSTTASPERAASPAGPAGGPTGGLGLVIERPNETVRSVLAALDRERIALVDYSQTSCWIANVRLLCEAVADGSVSAGAALLPYAADAIVLAGKLPVQGTRPGSVAAAIRHFAANLLIIEHAFSTYHEMRQMLRMFAAERPARPQAKVLMDALGELERSDAPCASQG